MNKEIKYFKTNFHKDINPQIHTWAVILVVITELILSESEVADIQFLINFIGILIFIILFTWGVLQMFFKTYPATYLDVFDKHLASKINRQFQKGEYIHIYQGIEHIVDAKNIGMYFKLMVILYASQFLFSYFSPVGTVLYILLIVSCLVFCLSAIFNFKKFENGLSIIASHIFIAYLLFAWGKNTYIRSYGSEIIGGFFEKSEYRTKYYVNLFPDGDRSKNYRVPADIYIYEEEIEDSDFEGNTQTTYQKRILLERAYFPNGGYLIFEECLLEIGEKVGCSDQDDEDWEIELTNEKVN